MKKSFVYYALSLLMTCSLLSVLSTPANALPIPDLPRSVSTAKATWTPQVNVGTFDDGQYREVWDYEALYSGVMVACGKFEQVRIRGATAWTPRSSIVAFYTTGTNRGQLSPFSPVVKKGTGMGTVHKCELSYDGKSLLMAGDFTSVNGVAATNVAKVSTSNGAVESFPVTTNGAVTDLIKGKNRYWLFGKFTTVNGKASTGIATLEQSGAFSTYYRSKLAGNISSSAGSTKAYRGVITADETRLVAIVNSSSIDGQTRRHLAVWDLGASSAVLRNWQLDKTRDTRCWRFMVGTGLAVVPGTHDAILTSTGGYNYGICDQTMRFSLDYTSIYVPVKWSNYTCGDTSHAAAATTGAVYSQGHMKCTEMVVNGTRDWADRNGIFALQTSTGNLYSWRSDQSRCVGGKSLYVLNKANFPQGLFSGVDCEYGIIFRPL